MKTRSAFWPLFRNELSLDRLQPAWFGVWLCLLVIFAAWCGWCLLPVIFLEQYFKRDVTALFSALGQESIWYAWFMLSMLSVWWIYALGSRMGDASVGDATESMGLSRPSDRFPLEFLFTRAIDRKTLFRAKSGAVFVWVILPLLLNLMASPLEPEITFGSAAYARPKPSVEDYLNAFPGSHPGRLIPEGSKNWYPYPMILRHGGAIFAGWLCWLGFLGFLLVEAAFLWLVPYLKNRIWWFAILWTTALIFSWCHPNRIYEVSFLYFARYPVPLVLGALLLFPLAHSFAERRFQELELS